MKKIRIGTSAICEAFKGAYNRFYPITIDCPYMDYGFILLK